MSIEAFKAAFQGDIVTADSPDYDTSIARWAASSVQKAKLVCFVKGTADIALALKFAKDAGLKVAIRGGGHDPAGTSSQKDGLIIDLSKYLNGVKVDAESKRAFVGGGALWETVDKTAIVHGLASVGGTVNHTGVGGLCLGGGYGWLTGEHGLVIDNLLEATIVIANGTVLKASPQENPDLFWAIRGGGSNFGVCVEFVLQLHEQRPAVLRILGIPIPARGRCPRSDRKLVESWSLSERGDHTDYHTRPASGLSFIPFYNGTMEEGREKFKAFLDLGPFDMTKETPYEVLNTQQNEYVKHGKQIHMRGFGQTSYSSSVAKQLFNVVSERSTPDLQINAVFELFPRQKLASISEDACAFNTRGPAHQVLALTEWAEASDDKMQKARGYIDALTHIIASNEAELKDTLEGTYPNYIGEDALREDTARNVFGDHYPKLQAIKKIYDPDMVFCKWIPISPA